MMLVRGGAADMLGVLFDRYQGPLFSFYAKLTGDRAASEDLVQEVFVRILKYRRTYKPGTAFRPWIYKIARNAHVDTFRKRNPEVELQPEMDPPAPGKDPGAPHHDEELLHRALLQLPEEKREVLLLSRFQGLPYEEIAEMTGTQVGTLKVRAHRALRDLREIFLRLRGGAAAPDAKTLGANYGL